MPAFKYRQKNSLIVFERGHKAHGYVQAADGFLLKLWNLNSTLWDHVYEDSAPGTETVTIQSHKAAQQKGPKSVGQ